MDSPNTHKRARMATPAEPVEMEDDCFPNVSVEPVPADYLGLPAEPVQPEIKEPAFYHFKIEYDQSWNYAAICEKMFMKEHPYLCVLEHINRPNTHVHFQGMSMVTENTMRDRLKVLASKHHKRKLCPTARPTSMAKRPVDAVGFQYMAKELRSTYVLAINKFTWKDLKELKEKSVMHCAALKSSLKEVIESWTPTQLTAIIEEKNPQELIRLTTCFLMQLADKGKIELPEYNPRHTRTSIIRGLLANKHTPLKMRALLYSL